MQKKTVDGDADLKTVTTTANDCFELQIRCDVGPGKKLAFRQALMAGTDLKALVGTADPGVALPGSGTLVGPGYKADYLSATVPYDRAKAKRVDEVDFVEVGQQILQRSVPMINFGVLLGVAGESVTVDGIAPSPHWEQTVFATGYFTQ